MFWLLVIALIPSEPVQANCTALPCASTGTCNLTTLKCVCDPYYSGTRCTTYTNCTATPCASTGTCNPTTLKCVCDKYYSGTRCTVYTAPTTACTALPCLNGGTCAVSGSSYVCTCVNGYTGTTCETVTVPTTSQTLLPGDPGYNNPSIMKDDGRLIVYPANDVFQPLGCENYGYCIDVIDQGYTYDCNAGGCRCNDGTYDPDSMCSHITDKCDGNDPCGQGNWDCESGISGPICTCKPGFTGPTCQDSIGNACEKSPCKNGGSCTVNGTGFICQCKDDWKGTTCEAKNQCEPNPCFNGATCEPVNDYTYFKCHCPVEFQGRRCGLITVQRGPLDYVGCFLYSEALNVLPRFADSDMTVQFCQSEMTKQLNPFYQYFIVQQRRCYFISDISILNQTNVERCAYRCSGAKGGCNKAPDLKRDYCGSMQNCLGCNVCSTHGGADEQGIALYTVPIISYEPNACDNDPCGESKGHGICVDEAGATAYTCVCHPWYTGSKCDTLIDPCENTVCENNGTAVVSPDRKSCSCDCLPDFGGANCEFNVTCNLNPCKYGQKCTDNFADGTYSCECHSLFTGPNCEHYALCQLDMCKNGANCTEQYDEIYSTYQCECSSGWYGYHCDQEIDECILYEPCGNGATCTDAMDDWSCACTPGWTGKNCTEDIVDCVPYTDEDGVTYENKCKAKDPGALCIDLNQGYSCQCSDDYVNEFCTLQVFIRDVLLQIYGEVKEDLISLLQDLMNNPSGIKDIVPFIIGLKDPDMRRDLSWSADEMFDWITYERKPLDLTRDLTEWNDVVLGNCFTFNHRDGQTTYKGRMSGDAGGIYARVRLQQDEYVPWYDTAAILTFIHHASEDIFSESVRYDAEPHGDHIIDVAIYKYTRLDGHYGRCIRHKDEVKQYYYNGEYTTDGCLRSCYQDAILSECGCMDPRYPMPPDTVSCPLNDRLCVEEAIVRLGDPSGWSDCDCPLPCRNEQFTVNWSRSKYELEMKSDDNDTVTVQVSLPMLTFHLFEEAPAMDLNQFISALGGLLGVLMGVSVVTFIEFIFIFARVFIILSTGKSV